MKRWTNRILILFFTAAIAAPAVWGFLVSPDEGRFESENRRAASFPSLSCTTESIRRFPNRFEAWFNDRLPFREELLQVHSEWKVNQLGVSSSDKVILGRDGWLFLDEEKSESTARSRTPNEQAKRWRDALVRRRNWLADRGIRYLIVITPEKHSVYPELLPAALQSVRQASASEILRNDLANTELEILDLVPALKTAKSERPVYLQTDTHWNDDGAYVAYREIVGRLAQTWPEMKAYERTSFEIAKQAHSGDLLRMLHLAKPAAEQTERLRLRSPQARRLPEVIALDPRLHSPQNLPPQAWGRPGSGLPRAVIFHDSFTERLLLPTLAEHCSVLAYVPSASFIPEIVEQFQPQIVIQQIVARKLNWHVPVHPRGF